MAKSKNTKRALLMSVLSMILCIAMLAGSTFAWFTDSVTSGKNHIIAGNLDVELYHKDGDSFKTVEGNTDLFSDIALWEPGAYCYEVFKVANVGTLALKYQLSTILDTTDGSLPDGYNTVMDKNNKDILAENGKDPESLLNALYVKVIDGDANLTERPTYTDGVLLKDYLEGKSTTASALEPGASTTSTVVIYWPQSEKDNTWNLQNGKHASNADPGTVGQLKVLFAVNLIATQAVSESDSFGNDYDANAKYNEQEITTNTVTAPVTPNGPTTIKVNYGSVTVPKGAADGNTLTLTIEPTDTPSDITVTAGQEVQAYDISVKGLREDNDKAITVTLSVGKNLTNVKLYHNADEVSKEEYNYDATTGIITFTTTSFSPFTVVYNKEQAIYNVTPETIQEYLNGEHGSMTDAKLILASGEYGMLTIGTPSKYAAGDTVYTCMNGNGHSNTPISFTDAEEFKAHVANDWHSTPYYTRTIDNLTLVGQEGVTVAGVSVTSGHAYGENSYDPVREKTVNGSCYYMTHKLSNITFKDISFTKKVDINTSNTDTVIDGVTFDGCSFNINNLEAGNQGLRYYNESNNGNVRNLIVKDCTFESCYQGIYTSNTNGIAVSKCTFNTTKHNAIAMQSGAHGAVNYKTVVIENNNFANIGDRIIRFGDIGADTQITIKNNTATNSGDTAHEVIKAQSLAEGITFAISGNDWGDNTKVANEELKDATFYILPDGVTEESFAENNAFAYADGKYYPNVADAVAKGGTIYLKPNSTTNLKGAHTVIPGNGITIYANGATFNSDLSIDTYDNSSNGGTDGIYDGVETVDITVYNAKNLYLWGQRNSNATVNICMVDCENIGEGAEKQPGRTVYLTGTSGTTNIVLKNARISCTDSPVYSNANGKIELWNCLFTECAVPVNINYKSTVGKQEVIIDGCSFANCGTDLTYVKGDGSMGDYAAPIRVVHSKSGSEHTVTARNTSVTGTKGGNGDMLIVIHKGGTQAITATLENNVTDIRVDNGSDEFVTIAAGATATLTNHVTN